ncbi:MAG: hypothetical protein U5L76_02005 [Patescibacteria group bacterium]|nr:hypothetical protein [Patescibacteria group bacterium]
MIDIIDFQPKYFENMVTCYQFGFPEGHNRYTLGRLARWQRDTIILARHNKTVVGVLIGIISYQEAWFTALTVLPTVPLLDKCSLHLVKAMALRFIELGFTEAYFTTVRRSVLRLAKRIKATKIQTVPHCYYDGNKRHLITVSTENLPFINQLL